MCTMTSSISLRKIREPASGKPVVFAKPVPTVALSARAASFGSTSSRVALTRCRAQRSVDNRSPLQVLALTDDLRAALDKYVSENKIVVFMKGTKQFPQCGFSNTTVQIMNTFQVPYETVNILEDDAIRSGMKEYSSWPTFPQVYIDGEFYGGCDIMIESYQNGELQEEIEKCMSQ